MILLVVAACTPIPAPEEPRPPDETAVETTAPLKVGASLPEFTLSTSRQELAADDDLGGTTTVLTFVSGSGPSAAPAREVLRRIAASLRRLRPELRRRVRPVAISMDGAPGFAAVRGALADPDAWLLLTGPPSELDRVALPLGVVSWTEDDVLTHTLRTVVITPDLRIADILPGIAPWTESDLLATLSRVARE